MNAVLVREYETGSQDVFPVVFDENGVGTVAFPQEFPQLSTVAEHLFLATEEEFNREDVYDEVSDEFLSDLQPVDFNWRGNTVVLA